VVSVVVKGTAVAANTQPLPSLLGKRGRFFFLQFRPGLPPSALSGHWTLVAKDARHLIVGYLHV
jgi:hypothetical protein